MSVFLFFKVFSKILFLGFASSLHQYTKIFVSAISLTIEVKAVFDQIEITVLLHHCYCIPRTSTYSTSRYIETCFCYIPRNCFLLVSATSLNTKGFHRARFFSRNICNATPRGFHYVATIFQIPLLQQVYYIPVLISSGGTNFRGRLFLKTHSTT